MLKIMARHGMLGGPCLQSWMLMSHNASNWLIIFGVVLPTMGVCILRN